MKILPALIIVLVFTAVTLAVTGCDINIVDKRLSKEEVVKAFQQRDQVLASMAQAIKTLQEDKLKEMVKLPEEEKADGQNKAK